jgi:hypothetical protein
MYRQFPGYVTCDLHELKLMLKKYLLVVFSDIIYILLIINTVIVTCILLDVFHMKITDRNNNLNMYTYIVEMYV